MDESMFRKGGKTNLAMAAYQAELYAALVASVVESKLSELANIPYGRETGRRLQLGSSSPEDAAVYLRRCFTDIAQRVGIDLFRQIPVILLDQLAVMSAVKSHDTAGLLNSLINSFLITYSTPETHDRAFAHLEGLEALRPEVAAGRAAQATKH